MRKKYILIIAIYALISAAERLSAAEIKIIAPEQAIKISGMEQMPEMHKSRPPVHKDDYDDSDDFEKTKPKLNPKQGKKSLFSCQSVVENYAPEGTKINDFFGRIKKTDKETEENTEDVCIPHSAKKKSMRHYVTLCFNNFNNDKLKLHFSIYESEYDRAITKYGYRDIELKSLCDTFTSSFGSDKRDAVSMQNNGIDSLNIPQPCMPKAIEFFAQRGIKLDPKTYKIYPDMPNLARREKESIRTLAADLRKEATAHKYSNRDIAGAALAMAQTAIRYAATPMKKKNGQQNYLGVYLPIHAIVEGHGDCDTKSLLVATLLSYWPSIKIIGIKVPGHYFLAASLTPEQGDETVTYNGQKYVVMEPAGPGWVPPGKAAPSSISAMKQGYEIDVF